MSTLIRNLRIGDRLSLEEGRIVISLDANMPKKAILRLTLAEDVVVDKPRVSANDERGHELLPSACKA